MSDALLALHLAIDLGASNGRAIVAGVRRDGLLIREVHRFHYSPRLHAGHLRWDFNAILEGLVGSVRSAQSAAASMSGQLASIGVDSWGVDYGLLDDKGTLLEDPVCYRDDRTAGMMDRVFASMPRDEIFARTGIQFLPINTLYQLAAHVREGLPQGAARLLMIPDLCHHELCGSLVTEQTNASTTQLMDVGERNWSQSIFDKAGLPLGLMPEVVAPGTVLGSLTRERQVALGVPAVQVVAPATHDTASAIAATSLSPGWAYISSGTWSLVGVELEGPIVNAEAARENFTNEAGVYGSTRFLKNVMGLWIHQACCREWENAGVAYDRAAVLEQVAATTDVAGVVFPDDLRFFNPSSMIRELEAALAESGQVAVNDPVGLTKVILDSLALRYASVIESIESLTGRHVPGIHIVGGGSTNEYLNQATANATNRPVTAGPAEATVIGNFVVQAIACGELPSLSEARRRLAQSVPMRTYLPRPTAAWRQAGKRYRDLEGAAVA